MAINITGNTGINTSTYTTTNSSKKSDIKKYVTSDTSKNQDVTQDLGKDTFVKSTTEEDTTNSTYKPVKKKLSSDEVKALKEDEDNLKSDFIKKFISDTINNQAKLLGNSTENGTSTLSKKSRDLLTSIFGSVENAYPPMATTPEGAKAAISEGGPYSVNAVADSIMTMATALAGDDQDKLQQMRDAVDKGFQKAGVIFKNATKSDLPQICNDTYTEVMKRFDKLQNKTTGTDEVTTS